MLADLKQLSRYETFLAMAAAEGPEGRSAARYANEMETRHPELPTMLREVQAAMRGERPDDEEEEDDEEEAVAMPSWLTGIERAARAFGEGQASTAGRLPLRPRQVDIRVLPNVQGEVTVLIRLRAADVLQGRIRFADVLQRVMRGFARQG